MDYDVPICLAILAHSTGISSQTAMSNNFIPLFQSGEPWEIRRMTVPCDLYWRPKRLTASYHLSKVRCNRFQYNTFC